MVLKVPIVSISMTVLKPFGVRADIGEMKLPAAPALGRGHQQPCYGEGSMQ